MLLTPSQTRDLIHPNHQRCHSPGTSISRIWRDAHDGEPDARTARDKGGSPSLLLCGAPVPPGVPQALQAPSGWPGRWHSLLPVPQVPGKGHMAAGPKARSQSRNEPLSYLSAGPKFTGKPTGPRPLLCQVVALPHHGHPSLPGLPAKERGLSPLGSWVAALPHRNTSGFSTCRSRKAFGSEREGSRTCTRYVPAQIQKPRLWCFAGS